jgi:glycerol-3-phosphate O-acyltransferase
MPEDTDPKKPFVPYEDYIGSKLFHASYKPDVIKRIKYSPKIQTLVSQLAQKKYEDDPSKPVEYYIHSLRSSVLDITKRMVANISSTNATRFFGMTVKTILGRMYHHGVHVRESEINHLKNVAEQAAKEGKSLIFLPCHKSHIDYLVVSHILYNIGIALPHIAAGDNLNLPGIGSLLSYNGAFFIRRQWGDDKLYVAVMKEYSKAV